MENRRGKIKGVKAFLASISKLSRLRKTAWNDNQFALFDIDARSNNIAPKTPRPQRQAYSNHVFRQLAANRVDRPPPWLPRYGILTSLVSMQALYAVKPQSSMGSLKNKDLRTAHPGLQLLDLAVMHASIRPRSMYVIRLKNRSPLSLTAYS